MYYKGQGDYLLAVKNNQSSLYENIEDSFRFLKITSDNETTDIGHGRIETRKCTVITDLAHIEKPERWKNLTVLVKMESERCFKATGKTEKAIRYYMGVSSLMLLSTAEYPWALGIENKLHWMLDVGFQEDADRKRNKNAAQNFSLINKVALNILKNDQTKPVVSGEKRTWPLGMRSTYLNYLIFNAFALICTQQRLQMLIILANLANKF